VNRESEPEIIIGRITAPFGRKGEVKVQLETDFPERLQELGSVWLKPPAGPAVPKRVESVRFHKNQALVKFEGVEDISAAENLRGCELRIPASQLKALPEGEFYIRDILGIRVVTEEGEDLGEVVEVIRAPANDVYVTQKALIPGLREVVREVDLQNRRMVIRAADGKVLIEPPAER